MPNTVQWTEGEQQRSALWRSEAGAAVPKRLVIVDDALTADAAHRLASEGTAMLWRGDFQNARQLLQALARRADRRQRRKDKTPAAPASAAQTFHLHRQAQGQRARILAMVLIELSADFAIALRRAPDWSLACRQAYGPADTPSLVSLRELLGVVGAYEWRKNGVEVAALQGRIHPHYGVFSPLRGEYIDLVAAAPLPTTQLAFDIGTGTGVLAVVLLRRGVTKVVATDQAPRALACAQDNLQRLGLSDRVDLHQVDLFPAGQAPLLLCNPPWVPARPSSGIEQAVYDEDSRMLRGFLAGAAAHLAPQGEAWLIMSDLAEHLGLRSRAQLQTWITEAGLQVIGRLDAKPRHSKVSDQSDPLHAARAAELTSLWRLSAVSA